jgi:hypothetical protein
MKLKAGSATQFPSSPMRKFSTVVLLIGMATGVLAQGTVMLQNQTGLVREWYGGVLISVPKNGGYVELIAAPVGTPLVGSILNYSSLAGFLAVNPGWAAAVNNSGAAPTPIALAAGLFSGGTYTINNIAEATNAEYFLIGWTGASTTWDAAFAGGSSAFGQSAIATTATGDPLATPVPGFPVSLRPTFPGLILGMPEPSTSALAGLGLAALLVFRRRN